MTAKQPTPPEVQAYDDAETTDSNTLEERVTALENTVQEKLTNTDVVDDGERPDVSYTQHKVTKPDGTEEVHRVPTNEWAAYEKENGF